MIEQVGRLEKSYMDPSACDLCMFFMITFNLGFNVGQSQLGGKLQLSQNARLDSAIASSEASSSFGFILHNKICLVIGEN
jgi:hypothetical protein